MDLHRREIAALTTALFALSLPLPGRTSVPPRPCTAPEYRQFDFWVGEWDVHLPNGKPAGANRIRRILAGCAIQENWTGTGGSIGTSYNIYDATRHQWHQTWVDNQGSLLQLDGEFANARMTLRGETVDTAGARALQRITWEPTAPGRVRQLWETSSDGGKTWTVAFDGRYVKRR